MNLQEKIVTATTCLIIFFMPFTAFSATMNEVLEQAPLTVKKDALQNAVEGSGAICGAASYIHFNGKHDDITYWGIRCNNNTEWLITIANDSSGTTTVDSCAKAKKKGLNCWRASTF